MFNQQNTVKTPVPVEFSTVKDVVQVSIGSGRSEEIPIVIRTKRLSVKAFLLFATMVLLLSIGGRCGYAQVVLPAPRTLKHTDIVSVFGSGSSQGSQLSDATLSARLLLSINLTSKINVFLSGCKAQNYDSTGNGDRDILSYESIFYPDGSGYGSQFGITYLRKFNWMPSDEKELGEDRVEICQNRLGCFINAHYTVIDIQNSNDKYNFESYKFQAGPLFVQSRQYESNVMRFIFGVSAIRMGIIAETGTDYKRALGWPNSLKYEPQLDFWGFGAKAAIQINNFTLEAEMNTNYSAQSKFEKYKGMVFVFRAIIAGSIYSIGQLEEE